MPRHPPCALNNEHTTNTNNNHHKNSDIIIHAGVNYTKHKRTEITQTTHQQPPHKGGSITVCSLMLASTIQFSHNTPTTPCQHQQCQQDSWSGTKKGDNAPDTQQCTNIQTTLFLVQLCMDNVCHKAPFKHLVHLIRCVFHPDNFSTIKVGSMTLAYSTNHKGATAPRKIKAP